MIPEQKEYFGAGEALVTDKEFRQRILESSRQLQKSREELLGVATPLGVPEGTIFNRLDTGEPIVLRNGRWVPMTQAPAVPPGIVLEQAQAESPSTYPPAHE